MRGHWGHWFFGVIVGISALWIYYNLGPRVGMGFGSGQMG